jgi:NAD(P)-dependent dehydrogenase (short-subunit alcohol dehydrogenase family)
LVTGGNAGIGYFVAEQLAGTGATLVLGSRKADRPDAVVFNAGVLLDEPHRRGTNDGHEWMFGINHLGHFALTGWLTPLLSAAPAGRIVTTGSFVGKSARLDLDGLQSARDYRPKRTYARSKLAQMLFGFELDRRLRAVGSTAPPSSQATRWPGSRSSRPRR